MSDLCDPGVENTAPEESCEDSFCSNSEAEDKEIMDFKYKKSKEFPAYSRIYLDLLLC